MLVLHNRIAREILKKNMHIDNEERITISFYKYVIFNNPKHVRDILYIHLNTLNILGRIYIAKEGINAQISVPLKNYNLIKIVLKQFIPNCHNLKINKSLDMKKSFWVLKIKVKKKLLCDGIENIVFNPKNVGIYIKAKEVNKMLHDKNVIFIDMRNKYEYEIGHFKKAINIPANTFREQLQYILCELKYDKNKTIVMYCTGGIRCEKATFLMKYNGFKNIYHIEGGILGYVHDAKKNNLPIYFQGKNFVFDARLGERVTNDIISLCHQCKMKCDSHKNCKYNFCHDLFIQCDICNIKFQGCCSIVC
ncbi:MAG TPA: rhodanese-related sulfurtransferase, partial [Buchnera sp. (in: enterobacteria)]|nr:rhodanese-related sulfurtransferase [Buchnera sp. (in: enterobacteria)]